MEFQLNSLTNDLRFVNFISQYLSAARIDFQVKIFCIICHSLGQFLTQILIWSPPFGFISEYLSTVNKIGLLSRGSQSQLSARNNLLWT